MVRIGCHTDVSCPAITHSIAHPLDRLAEDTQITIYLISHCTGWRFVLLSQQFRRSADITQANVETMLALDIKYLEHHLEPVAKWGEQQPHE